MPPKIPTLIVAPIGDQKFSERTNERTSEQTSRRARVLFVSCLMLVISWCVEIYYYCYTLIISIDLTLNRLRSAAVVCNVVKSIDQRNQHILTAY